MKKHLQPYIQGNVEAGFEEIQSEFVRNFTERGEIGASCCVYFRGKKVVDLWGGYRNKKTGEVWEEHTIVKVFSTTKGMALLSLAKLHSDGLVDYEKKVSHYWPEFAKNGKERITVEQLITHKGGLVLLERPVKVSELHDFKLISRLLEHAKPMWVPGQKHGYHSATIGLYLQHLVQGVDPKHRTLGKYFAEKIAGPLDADFYIGIPDDLDVNRIARLQELIPPMALFSLKKVPKGLLRQLLNPGSLMMKSFSSIKIDVKDPVEELRYEEASGTGVGEARALAKIYGSLANGGKELNLNSETLQSISKRTDAPKDGNRDEVMKFSTIGTKVGWSSGGFCKPNEEFDFGSDSAYGFYGTGGSFAFADPEHEIGYAYFMNKMDFYTQNDPREVALREAMYRVIARK